MFTDQSTDPAIDISLFKVTPQGGFPDSISYRHLSVSNECQWFPTPKVLGTAICLFQTLKDESNHEGPQRETGRMTMEEVRDMENY